MIPPNRNNTRRNIVDLTAPLTRISQGLQRNVSRLQFQCRAGGAAAASRDDRAEARRYTAFLKRQADAVEYWTTKRTAALEKIALSEDTQALIDDLLQQLEDAPGDAATDGSMTGGSAASATQAAPASVTTFDRATINAFCAV